MFFPGGLQALELNEDAALAGETSSLAGAGNSAPTTPFTPKVLQVVKEVKKRRFLIATLPELGHLNPVLHIGAELAQRGHDVKLASCAFVEPKVGKRCRELGIEFVALATDVQSPDTPGSKAAALKEISPLVLYTYYNDEMLRPLKEAVTEARPHQILADFMTVSAFEAGDACGVPVASNFADPVFLNAIGASPNPLLRLVLPLIGPIMFRQPLSSGAAIARFGWQVCESFYTRLCIVNSFWGVQPITLMPPNVVLTGPMGPRTEGVLQETSMRELNSWIEWVRQKGLRVIYVTFGSMAVLTPAQVRAIYEGLAELPGIAVAWSLKEAAQAHLPGRPERFFVHPWFPQAEVLKLPEVVAVVTHCGWGGMMEICMAGKPIVGVPFHGDQPFNAEMARVRGFAEVVPARRLSAAALREAMSQVLTTESYTESVQKVQAALLTSGGAWYAALHLEFSATYNCSHLVRPVPSLSGQLARVAGAGLLLAAACLAVADHARRILRK